MRTRPWPTSPNIIPNMSTNVTAANGVGSMSAVARGTVDVDQRPECARPPQRPQERRAGRSSEATQFHERDSERSEPAAQPVDARRADPPHDSRDRTMLYRGAGTPRDLRFARKRRPVASPLRGFEIGRDATDTRLPADRVRLALETPQGIDRRPASAGSSPDSSTAPSSASATSASRSRSCGAMTAMRRIRTGSADSGNGIEHSSADGGPHEPPTQVQRSRGGHRARRARRRPSERKCRRIRVPGARGRRPRRAATTAHRRSRAHRRRQRRQEPRPPVATAAARAPGCPARR